MDRMLSCTCPKAERLDRPSDPSVQTGGSQAPRLCYAKAIAAALCGAWLTSAAAFAQPAGEKRGGSHSDDAASQATWRAVNGTRETHIPGALLDEIISWLAANFDLPVTIERPNIVLVPAGELARLHFHIMLQRQQQGRVPPGPVVGSVPVGRQIAAFYDETTQTIHLPETWHGADPRAVSVLVHEVAHHLQHKAGLKYACGQAREQLAFAAQEKWLAISGMSLESAFRMNRMTVFLRTRCLY
jgi:hypothetical protein